MLRYSICFQMTHQAGNISACIECVSKAYKKAQSRIDKAYRKVNLHKFPRDCKEHLEDVIERLGALEKALGSIQSVPKTGTINPAQVAYVNFFAPSIQEVAKEFISYIKGKPQHINQEKLREYNTRFYHMQVHIFISRI